MTKYFHKMPRIYFKKIPFKLYDSAIFESTVQRHRVVFDREKRSSGQKNWFVQVFIFQKMRPDDYYFSTSYFCIIL